MPLCFYHLFCSLVYFYFAAESLKYYAAKTTPSEKAIQVFFGSLSSPLKFLYVRDSRHNILTVESKKPVVEYLQSVSYWNSLIARSSWALVLALVPLAPFVSLLRSNEIGQILSDGFGVLFHSTCLFLSWRFGHNLPEIEASLNQEKQREDIVSI